MTFNQLFATLRARWRVALGTLAFIVLATLALNLLVLPKLYTATASVVVDPKPDPVASMVYGGMATAAFLSTQINVLESDRVASRVVRVLKLADSPQMRAKWLEATEGKGDIVLYIGKLLQNGLEVVPAKDSNVLMVNYTSPDPAFSTAVANTFVQAYIDTVLEMRTDPAKQFTTFFDARAKQARDRLEAAQAKLSEYQRDKGLIVTSERIDIENARLNELSSQLVVLQAALAESRSRRSQANQSPNASADVINNPIVSGLRADLLRYEAQLQETSARLGSNHPQVVELNARIAALRSKIADETRRVTSSVTINNTINEQRVSDVAAALDAQRAKLLKMKEMRDEAAVLEHDVQTAQQAYDQIQSRLTATSLESQATLTNLYVLTRASEPTDRSSPKVLRNTLIAFGLGLFLAVVAAFVRELFDKRVRTVHDLMLAVDAPVLGVLPGSGSRRRAGRPHALWRDKLAALPGPRPHSA
jgi:chain length determinant protein EpsF